MRVLRRFWEDIRRGKNIGLYTMVIVAIILTVLDLVGLAPRSWVARINLAMLGLLATAMLGNRDKVEQVLQKLAQMPRGLLPGATIYEHWMVKEVYDVIRSAKESVVIVESWVGEAPTLSGCIKHASRHSSGRLKVDIYMLDPDKSFGAQRRAEVDGYSNGADMEWQKRFQEKFEDAAATIQRHLSGVQNIDLTIYKYATMPEIKMYVVDDEEFIFSWFPVDGPSSDNVCFHLSASSPIRENLLAVDRLRNQLKGIHNAAINIPLTADA